MEIEKAVGEELRACRRKKQISQEQLGFDAAILANARLGVESIPRRDRMQIAQFAEGIPV
jgi:transcriptional regulator with XRE-family HTH domain